MADYWPPRIRDHAAQLLGTLPGFAGRVQANAILPMKAADLPCIRCTLLGRTMSPDGDATAGEPKFISSLRLGISALINADAVDALDTSLYQATEDMLDVLLTSPAWLASFEAITAIEASYHMVDQASSNAELLMAEARLIITIRMGEAFEPVLPDSFQRLHMASNRPGATSDKPFGADIDLPS
ncbi:hypothetical protein K32_24030 [Kaistia sp. 32K]|uniref:hypothetical protein n=1 Tax=Kaistia sp. 32K TaxID=2795690 RepID=UPI00191522B3|nr:hypothetical protein [Kaistia sp. 32K]BCP53786.1 hypothetical protein K32_24030 [Kaistia sp. 32K]